MKLNKAVPAVVVCSILAAVHVSATPTSAVVGPGASANAFAAPGEREFLTLKRDLVIPDRNAGKEDIIAGIRSICVDDNGTIYVLDDKDDKVKVFGADGSFIRSFGKKGQGPGEFQYPSEIFAKKNGTISVYDLMTRRISDFSSDGAYIGGSDPIQTGMMRLFSLSAENEAAFYGDGAERDENGAVYAELVRVDKKTGAVSIITRVKDEYDLPRVDPTPENFFMRTRSNGELIWASSRKYELFIESPDGRKLGRITRPDPKVRFTEKDREALLEKRYGGKDKRPKNVEFVWPEYFPPITRVVLDDRDWLYVGTCDKDGRGSGKYDVFDAAGAYRGSFHFERSILVIKKGRAYVAAEDEEGLPVLERYEMTPAK